MPCAYEMQRLTLLLKEAMRINISLAEAIEEIEKDVSKLESKM